MIFEGVPNFNAPSTAHGARSAAATEFCASRRDALNEEPASFSPVLIYSMTFVVAHTQRP